MPLSANSGDTPLTVPSAEPSSHQSTRLNLPTVGQCYSNASSAGSESTSGSGTRLKDPTSSSRVYSPSQTADWLQCPILRQFKRPSVSVELGETEPHVWSEKSFDWEPARLLGIAVQEGYNLHLQGKDEERIEAWVTTVIERGFVEQPKFTREGLLKLCLRGVEVLIDSNLFDRHAILELDIPLSHSRPDIVSRHESQGLGVTDLKVAQRIDERYRTKRMSEYETDDQFWHYAWELEQHYGEPVKWFRVVQAILTPKAQVLQTTVEVDPKRLQFWLEGARQHWADMQAEDEGLRPVVSRWQNCRGNKFGPCMAFDYCHDLERNPVRAVTYYDRVPKS